MSTDDSKTLNDAVECGLKNEKKVEELKQISFAYTVENAQPGAAIKQISFRRATAKPASNTCGWCGREPHEKAICQAKEKAARSAILRGTLRAYSVSPRVRLEHGTRTGKTRTVEQIALKHKREPLQKEQYSKTAVTVSNQLQVKTSKSHHNDSSLNSVSNGKSQAGSQKKTIQSTDEEFDKYQRFIAATEWDNNGPYMFI